MGAFLVITALVVLAIIVPRGACFSHWWHEAGDASGVVYGYRSGGAVAWHRRRLVCSKCGATALSRRIEKEGEA